MLIHIIRHTTPNIESGICYGQSDLPLATTFEAESKIVLEKLLNHYNAIFTSPLQRCSRLSEKLEADKRYIDPRLMEYNFGDWELTSWDKLTSDTARNWMDDYVEQAAPNGENLIEMQARVLDFWQELLASNYQRVAVITHAGVQRIIHGSILDTPLSHLFRLQLDYGSVLKAVSDKKSGLITIKHL